MVALAASSDAPDWLSVRDPLGVPPQVAVSKFQYSVMLFASDSLEMQWFAVRKSGRPSPLVLASSVPVQLKVPAPLLAA